MASLLHDENHWTDEFTTWLKTTSRESSSGVGSTLSATRQVRSAIEHVLLQSKIKGEIKTFLDVPCGDWNWMQHVVSRVWRTQEQTS